MIWFCAGKYNEKVLKYNWFKYENRKNIGNSNENVIVIGLNLVDVNTDVITAT